MDKLSVSLKYVVLIVGTLTTFFTIISIEIWREDLATFDNYLKIISAGITLTTLVYAAINFHLIQQHNKEQLILKKKEFSTSLISQFNSPEMTSLSVLSKKLKTEVKDLDTKEVVKLLQSNKESQVAIVAMLNFYEKLALSIEHEMADETVLRDFFRGIIRNTYNVLKDYIYYKRKEMENQKVFEKFENLALKWA